MKTGLTFMIAAIGALGGSGIVSGFHVPFLVGGYAPPAQCVEWYNGCNVCTRSPGAGASCTNKICSSAGKGFCEQYATSTKEEA